MTAYAFKAYLRYLRKAKGRHGVHSPFVYRFIDTCLRKQGSRLENIRDYFGQDQLTELAGDDPEQWAVTMEHNGASAIFLVKNIHCTKQHAACWSALCSDPLFTLSLDLFQYGLLFKNADFKEKQHFILK